jgi:hypothetical protein
MAAFEAFLQDNLTFARWQLEDSADPTATAILGIIDELKAQRGRYQTSNAGLKRSSCCLAAAAPASASRRTRRSFRIY